MNENLPKTIRIGPFDYTIEVNENLIPDDLLGFCDKIKGVIVLHPRLSEQMLRSTLLHEILHGICGIFESEKDDVEERMVTAVAPLLYELLRDNPELTEFLFNEYKPEDKKNKNKRQTS